jgi:hypothetical protein
MHRASERKHGQKRKRVRPHGKVQPARFCHYYCEGKRAADSWRMLGDRFLLDGFRDRVDVQQYLLCHPWVADFQAKVLVEREDELQGIDGVEPQAPRTE